MSKNNAAFSLCLVNIKGNDNISYSKFDEPFTTYNQQINILKHRRLIIRNRALARHYLSEYSYYNLSNGIGRNYSNKRNSNGHKIIKFEKGVSLNYLVTLQIFDQRVRSILFPQILNIETSLDTKLSHLIGEKFAVNAVGKNGYLNKKYYVSNRGKTLSILKNLSLYNIQMEKTHNHLTHEDLDKLVNQHRSHVSKPLKHYLINHNDVPPWILITNLTFGNVAHWFKILEPKDKLIIINKMLRLWNNQNIRAKDIISLFNTCLTILVIFRNACAHGDIISQIKVRINEYRNNYERLLSYLLLGYSENGYLIKPGDYKAGSLYSCIIAIILLTDDRKQLVDFLKGVKELLKYRDRLTINLRMPKNAYNRINKFMNKELFY